MDRNRGNRGRGSGGYRDSSASYSSYNNPNKSDNWPRSQQFSGNTQGGKRRYEDTLDQRKSFNSQSNSMSLGPQESSHKQFRPDFRGPSERRSTTTHNNQSMRGGMTSRGRDRFRGNFNKQFNHNPHRPERRNEDDYASPRRFPENRASYRPAPRATSSSHRGRSNWEKNSSQQIHARAKQVAPSPQKDSSSTSPNKFKSDETTTKELWADVTVSPLLSNHDEMDDDEYASASEVHFSSTRDDDCGNIDEEESTPADASEKKTFKEEPPSGDEDELNPDQDSSRKDESALSKTKRKKPTSSQDLPQYFIRLQCPHCHQRSVTFREYIGHLSSQRHAESLRKISLQHRMSLAKLRTRQRKEQLQIEAQSSRPAHSSRMNFCAICKLYHSESRPNHETTELHKIIKNFLMPYCPICRVNFKSRMLYEKHVATLTHIKNKINMEKTYERRRKEERKTDPTGDQEDFVLLDLDNFMTLDAVGSVDGDGDGCPSLEDGVTGEEFVKKVEVYFCDVCQRYLSRTEPIDKVLELHCRTRTHHHAVEERQRENENSSHSNAPENEECGSSTQPATQTELKRTASEERLWDEAEKDIGGVGDTVDDAETVPAVGKPNLDA